VPQGYPTPGTGKRAANARRARMRSPRRGGRPARSRVRGATGCHRPSTCACCRISRRRASP